MLRKIEGHKSLIIPTAHHCGATLVGVGREAARKRDQCRERGVVAQFVDRGTTDLAVDSGRRPHRRNEDDVARLQLVIVRGVSAQQQVIQIEPSNYSAASLQLDIAQGTGGLDAARGIERARDGGEAAHGVRARLIRLTDHKNADGTRVAHANAHLRTDHLPRHTCLDVLAHGVELLARHRDRPEFREIHPTVATDDES